MDLSCASNPSGARVPLRATVWVSTARPFFYFVIVICSMVAAFTYKLRTDGIFACSASGYSSKQYLAYCQTSGYGEYDQGAFWFGMEPQAQQAAADADVLFLGNSRMQFALSTQATSQWFASLPARFYLLGFSFGENARFEEPLLSRLRPKAALFVINVDRFFDKDWVTPPTAALAAAESDAKANYQNKRRWQSVHRRICSWLPSICGHEVAFFRARDTGAWEFQGSRDVRGVSEVSDAADAGLDRARVLRDAAYAEAFLSKLPVARECVVLTQAPWNATNAAEARAIAAALNLDLVTPKVEGLHTFDGDHLDRASAERWSAAFFKAAGPRMLRCLREQRATPR
jgi:hypothetical protein